MVVDGLLIKQKIIERAIKKKKKDVSLSIFLIGNDPSSRIYVRNKIRTCDKNNIKVNLFHLDIKINENDLIKKIKLENNNQKTTGILIQLPLPVHLNETKILTSVDYKKDVDGLHPINQGLTLLNSEKAVIPCTPGGIMAIFREYKIDLKGKKITIIGKSNIVGKPLNSLLINNGATTTICDINTKTKDLIKFCLNADIIVSATGVKHLINEKMVSPNTVLIDVGIIRDKKTNKIFGDIDFEKIKDKAKLITPVPKGVGAITVAMVIENLIKISNNEN